MRKFIFDDGTVLNIEEAVKWLLNRHEGCLTAFEVSQMVDCNIDYVYQLVRKYNLKLKPARHIINSEAGLKRREYHHQYYLKHKKRLREINKQNEALRKATGKAEAYNIRSRRKTNRK